MRRPELPTEVETVREASRRRFMTMAGTATAAIAASAASAPATARAATTTYPRDPGAIWATDYGTIGQGGDDTAVLTEWLRLAPRPGQSAGQNANSSLFLPAGTYRTSKTLVQYQSTVVLDPGAIIQPTDDFGGGPLWRTDDGLHPLVEAGLRGGTFDCRGIAQGIMLSYYAHFTLKDVVVRDYEDFGVQAGADTYLIGGGAVPNSYELFMSDVVIHRTLRETWDPSAKGVYFRKSTDNEIDDVIVHGAGIGVQVSTTSSACNFSDVHVWGDPATKAGASPAYPDQRPLVCFLDSAQGTSYVHCTADSPVQRGFDLESDSTRLTACRVFAGVGSQQGTSDAIYIAQPGARISVVNCLLLAVAGHEFDHDIAVPDGGPNPLIAGSNVFVGNVCTSSPRVAGAPNGAMSRLLDVRLATDSVKLGWLQASGLDMYSSDFGTKTAGISPNGAITAGSPAGLGASFYSGKGTPSGVLSANAGDLYVDKAGPKGSWLYRCSGGKAWVPMV